MLKHKMIFYAEDQTSGTPAEPAPAATPAPAPVQGSVPTPNRANTQSVLGKAPIIEAKAPTGEVPKEESEVIVSGPAEGKEPTKADPEPKDPALDAPKKGEEGSDKSEDEGKTTIGGLSYSEQEWARFAKDYENDTEWRSANTKKSQIINKFNDDIINELAPYALGQKEVPKDLKDKMVSDWLNGIYRERSRWI